MKYLVAAGRLVAAVLTLAIGGILVAIGSLVPGRWRGARPAVWLVIMMVRFACVLFRVKVTCAEPRRLHQHVGFIFPNHLSLLDSFTLLHVMPVRFLSMAEVSTMPVIGWFAKCMGTVFVARDNPDSRRQARHEIARAFEQEPSPPIVIFPEGHLGLGNKLLPFRHGAFQIAAGNQIPYLLCAIRYEPMTIALWRSEEDEVMISAVWRLATYTGSMKAELIPLDLVSPMPDDDAAQLAQQARDAISAALGLDPSP